MDYSPAIRFSVAVNAIDDLWSETDRTVDQRIITTLDDLRSLQDYIDGKTRRLVNHLRFVGTPWSVIGEGLGVSKQAAQQRFSADL